MSDLSSLLSTMTNVLLAAFGIGLLIFVHELGHFLCARWIGARVEVFSLGFGPRLFGWRRGATDYRLSLVPLGGYVQVAGQDPADRRYPAAQNLSSKSIGQRMLFFSGGVLMNLLFALVAFPLVFRAGVDFQAPVVGSVEAGGAAWEAELQPGDRILEVDGKRVYSFEVLGVEVALAGRRGVDLQVRRGDDQFARHVQPHFDDASGIWSLGIGPAFADAPPTLEVAANGPAAGAGLHNGDRLLAIGGDAIQPGKAPAGLEPALKNGQPVQLMVGTDAGERTLTLTPTPAEPQPAMIGVRPLPRRVAGIRPGLPLIDDLGLRRGDLVLGIDGQPLGADGLAIASTRPDLHLDVLRDGELRRLSARGVDAAARAALAAKVALVPAADELVLQPIDDSPAQRAGLQAGDRLLAVDGRPIERWQQLVDAVRSAAAGKALQFTLLRPDRDAGLAELAASWTPQGLPLRAQQVQLQLQPQRPPLYDLGMVPVLQMQREQYQAADFVDALRLGTVCSIDLIKQLYVTLKRLFSGDVAAKNLGGIITISRVSYQQASWGLSRLFYFLALLSINLAFINVLPIPVLDGGHLLFLLIERIKGSPVSTTVLNYSQILGLIFVLALVVFVTYNDILRLL